MADLTEMILSLGTKAEITIDTWWDCRCEGDHDDENKDCPSTVIAGFEVTIGANSDRESHGHVALADIEDSDPGRALREAVMDALDLYQEASG